MARMTEDELRALTDSEMRRSVGYWGGKLAEQRRKAEYYYLGLPKGDLTPPEVEGRSQVVSPDVRNTIEAMLRVWNLLETRLLYRHLKSLNPAIKPAIHQAPNQAKPGE